MDEPNERLQGVTDEEMLKELFYRNKPVGAPGKPILCLINIGQGFSAVIHINPHAFRALREST